MITITSPSTSNVGYTSGGTTIFGADSVTSGSYGYFMTETNTGGTNYQCYTTGALSTPGGDGSSARTGTESSDTTINVALANGTTVITSSSTGTSSFSILPPYVAAVYLMRIK